MKRAVLYARVSGDDRRNEDRNLTGQLTMCRDYARSRGYEIVTELAEDDRGASGAAFELEQLNRASEMARNGAFDVFVTREIDRLSRNLAKQLIVEAELKRFGVTIEYVLGEYPDTPEGRLNKHIKATIAEYEREKITERTTRARRLKVQAGSTMFNGNPPYGYKEIQLANGHWALEIVPEEARVVRLIFSWYVSGDGVGGSLTLAGITHRLTQMGIPTQIDSRGRANVKKRAVGTWARGTVWTMLKNETYSGHWTFADTGLEVRVPPIIDHDLWEAAQARLASNRVDAPRNVKHEYLLRRRVTCGRCGLKMRGVYKPPAVTKRPYFYYRCPANARTLRAHDCDMPIFRTDAVDPMVWGWVRSFLADPSTIAVGLEAKRVERESENRPLRERLAVVEDLLADSRVQLERLLDLYLTGQFPKDVLTDRKVRLEETIQTLDRERAGLLSFLEARALTDEQISNVQEFAVRVGRGLDEVEQDYEVQRRLVELLDVRVILNAEDGQRVAYARCMLGDDALSLPSRGNGTIPRWPSPSAA